MLIKPVLKAKVKVQLELKKQRSNSLTRKYLLFQSITNIGTSNIHLWIM